MKEPKQTKTNWTEILSIAITTLRLLQQVLKQQKKLNGK